MKTKEHEDAVAAVKQLRVELGLEPNPESFYDDETKVEAALNFLVHRHVRAKEAQSHVQADEKLKALREKRN